MKEANREKCKLCIPVGGIGVTLLACWRWSKMLLKKREREKQSKVDTTFVGK